VPELEAGAGCGHDGPADLEALQRQRRAVVQLEAARAPPEAARGFDLTPRWVLFIPRWTRCT
jgi:hypothetical protein